MCSPSRSIPAVPRGLGFSPTLTTTVFSQCRSGWFGASPCRQTPEGHDSSIASIASPTSRTAPALRSAVLRHTEDLDVLEDRRLRLPSRRVPLAMHPLLLQCREEALHHRVVPAVGPSARAAFHRVPRQQLPAGPRRAGAAAVRVVRQPLRRRMPLQRHPQRARRQLPVVAISTFSATGWAESDAVGRQNPRRGRTAIPWAHQPL